MNFRVYFLAVICTLAGCQTFENMDAGLLALKGKPYQSAFEVLGFPDGESEIAGKRVFSWGTRQTGTYTVPTFSTSTVYAGGKSIFVQSQGTRSESYDYNCRIDLIVGSTGIIENAKYEGNIGGCERYAQRLRPKKQ